MALVFSQGGGRVRTYLVCCSERDAAVRTGGTKGVISKLATYIRLQTQLLGTDPNWLKRCPD